MDDKSLQKIGKLIDQKISEALRLVNQRLSALEKRLSALEKKLEVLELKIEAINKKIDKSQEETIEAISNLIQTGSHNHEQRIQRLEKHTRITSG